MRLVVKCVKKASALKQQGNEQFKAQNYSGAIDCYTEAIEYCPIEEAFDGARAVYFCNRAACHLSLEDYDLTIKDCTEAIGCDSRYVKAYKRRAQAYEAKEDLEKALKDLATALYV